VLLSIIAHLVMVILILVAPKWFPWLTAPRRVQVVARQGQPEPPLQYMMVSPRVERPVQKAPPRALPFRSESLRRLAGACEEAGEHAAVLARQTAPSAWTSRRAKRRAGRGRNPTPRPAVRSRTAAGSVAASPESQSALQMPSSRSPTQNGANGRSATAGGSLGDALRNLQRYTQGESFDNQGGGGGQFGPEIQFDTKGVEFGPWIRRFIAQVKRNWFIPYAAMSMKGHVVIRSTSTRTARSPTCRWSGQAGGCLQQRRLRRAVRLEPDAALPPEYPDSKAFFTVTFFYTRRRRGDRSQRLGLLILLFAFIV